MKKSALHCEMTASILLVRVPGNQLYQKNQLHQWFRQMKSGCPFYGGSRFLLFISSQNVIAIS